MSIVANTIIVVLGINKNTPVATLIETSNAVISQMTANKATFAPLAPHSPP